MVENAPAASSSDERAKLALAVAFGACAGNVGALISAFWSHIWLLDVRGHPIAEDFVAFWAAGRQAITGHAVAAYDERLQHAAEVAVVGHPVSATLGWSYPPVFLLLAALLAGLPYVSAFVAWIAATVAGYCGIVAGILKRPSGILFAGAAPWVVTAVMPGQNGFLTAGLLGASLLLLESRPAAAGLLIGLTAYKPQFAVLFLAVLAGTGNWRALVCAGLTALLANALAGTIFGFDTIPAFYHALAGTTQSHLVHSGLGWNKLQSLYGLLRSLGCAAELSWTAQILFSVAAALMVSMFWRTSAPYAFKAALFAAVVPLLTPYVFVYDLPVLAIPFAFLLRDGEFDTLETFTLAATVPCIFGFLLLPVPTAFFASLLVGAVAARRATKWSVASRANPLVPLATMRELQA